MNHGSQGIWSEPAIESRWWRFLLPIVVLAMLVAPLGPVSRADAGPSKLLAFNMFSAGAQESNGKVVAAGLTTDRQSLERILVVRFGANGRIDNTFGDGNGVVTLGERTDLARDVAVAADGRIYILGSDFNASTGGGAALLARLFPDGSLDQSFGDRGVAAVPGLPMSRIALQSDGKVVAIGVDPHTTASGPSMRFALARFSTDGSLDQGFGGDGIVTTEFDDSSAGSAVSVQPDGRIVAVGTSRDNSTGEGMAVARYLGDGSPDPTFGGGDGMAVTKATDHRNAYGADLQLQAGGRILVAGGAWELGRGFVPVTTPMLVRFTGDGALDQSFGDGGDGERLGGCVGGLQRLALGSGSIFAAGGGCQLRYSADGSGVSTIRDGPVAVQERGGPLLIASDGSVTFGGSQQTAGTDPPGDESAALTQYRPDGLLDPGFGMGGVVFLPEFRRCQGQLITDASTGWAPVMGSVRADVIGGTSEADLIFGDGGKDLVCAGGGDDSVRTGDGTDRVLGGAGADLIAGGAESDHLFGNTGNDRLLGGTGADRLFGGGGNDMLWGGPGRDSLVGGTGRDQVRP